MKYRFEELDHVEVDYPYLYVEARLWCCQIFRVPLRGVTAEDVATAREEIKRQMEHHFQNGLVSVLYLGGDPILSMAGPPIRSSAGYAACTDPVLMVLRKEILIEKDNQIFLVTECGLIERSDLLLGMHWIRARVYDNTEAA